MVHYTLIQVCICIIGKVQGVWFRASTKQKAEQLGLTGWVKNTNEGYVEAFFQGEPQQVNEMITWCKQGPPLAEVETVKILDHDSVTSTFERFSIRY